MAAPTQVTNTVIMFDAAGQELTTIKFRIDAIVWASSEDAGRDIAADDDMLLKDAEGNVVVGKRAEAAGDGLELAIPGGIIVNGVDADVLDGGKLFLIGEAL